MNRSRVLLFIIMMTIPSPLCAQVPYARIVGADKEPGSWLTYSGNYAAHRFSPLSTITAANVAGLKPVWGDVRDGTAEHRHGPRPPLGPADLELVPRHTEDCAGDRLSARESWRGPAR
jgi:hypothetical protein